MHTSEGGEVATPPPPQGRQLPRRRRRYAVARTVTNRPRAGKEAVTEVIGKAYRREKCARSTIYVCLYRAGFTVVIPTYRRILPSRWPQIYLVMQGNPGTHIILPEAAILYSASTRSLIAFHLCDHRIRPPVNHLRGRGTRRS